MSVLKRKFWVSTVAGSWFMGLAQAYGPGQPPTTGDLPCTIDTSAAAQRDTVAAGPGEDGFRSLFDGTFKGWWQNCQTSHSSGDRVKGAIWRIYNGDGYNAIYSLSRNGNGGFLATKKRWRHYELVFDSWFNFGDDGGVMNRCTLNGTAYQTLLDYKSNGGFFGSYPEGNPPMPNVQFSYPFQFTSNDSTIVDSKWASYTRALKAAGVPTYCAAPDGGCTQADWRRTWNMSSSPSGWNTIRIKYYGGLGRKQSAAGDKIRMQAFYRPKTDPYTGRNTDLMQWIPIYSDSVVLTDAQAAIYGPNPFAFQVHGGQGAFSGGRWYRNIRVRDLDSLGNVLPGQVPTRIPEASSKGVLRTALTADAHGIRGYLEADYKVTVMDARGRVLERFSGPAGMVSHAFRLQAHAIVRVEVKAGARTQVLDIKPGSD